MDRVDLYRMLYRTMMACHTKEQFLQIDKLIRAHRVDLGAVETSNLLREKGDRYNELLASRALLI